MSGSAPADGNGSLPTSAFDYVLPPELIAQHPTQQRDESRLLVLERATGRTRHLHFRDLPSLVAPGDALVLNETRVFPARILGRKPTGAPAEVLLLRPLAAPGGEAAPGAENAPRAAGALRGEAAPRGEAAHWLALVRPGGKLKPGRVIDVAQDFRIHIRDSTPAGERIVELDAPDPAAAIERYGRMPLPPYIEREAELEDRERYQTVYARATGSVAAPTAGLHFTPALLAEMESRGVDVQRLVLHVGVGTFRPVEVEDPASHRMHEEYYEVSDATAARLNVLRAAGGAIWAVGTTVARTLETVVDDEGKFEAGSGWTDIFIRPPHRFRAVDRLITNFHLPRSTLLMLVSALGGHEQVMTAYGQAVRQRYRFYSYGDAMAVI